MPIEIIVGLPHLADGPILRRARAMGVPVLISANCLSRWSTAQGWREWTGWRLSALANAAGLRSIDLDSAGFSALRRYRGYPWTLDAYMQLARSYPFRRFFSLDYCVEPELAADREEVLDRISRTIRANRECRARAVDLGLTDAFCPVLQGRSPADYERCADALAWSMNPGSVIGVGSMCRRPVAGPEGLLAVFEHLDRVLPAGVMLHGFGVKGTALAHLSPLAHRIASIDSQAYGVAARQEALQLGISKTDGLVADHLEHWTGRQLDRRAEPAPAHQVELALDTPTPAPADPWEAAIAIARAQIRSLIEEGQLDHNEVTAGWVEEWAADLSGETPDP